MPECPFCKEIYSGTPDKCPHCGEDLTAVNAEKPQPVRAVKSKLVAALLAFFIGETGAHRFYLGYRTEGLIQVSGLVALIMGYGCCAAAALNDSVGTFIVSIVFLLYGAGIGIWAFVDFIRIVAGYLMPADGTIYTEDWSSYVRSTQAQPSNPNDSARALETLARLRQQGILTEEEFEQKKAELLKRL